MKETKQLMSLSDISEEEVQELYNRGKISGLTEPVIRKLLEQSLSVGKNLDYFEWQMRHWEAWCEVHPIWKVDPYRNGRILRPITNWPSELGPRPDEIIFPESK